MKVQANAVKALMICALLLISQFALLDTNISEGKRVDYETENKDWFWTMEDLASNATETVNKTGSVYTFTGNVTVLQKDTLIIDPGETLNLMDSDLTVTWVIRAAMEPLIELAQSAARYPHVPVGADFEGYDAD